MQFRLTLAATATALLLVACGGGGGGGPIPDLDRLIAQVIDHARTIGFSDALPRLFGSGWLPRAAKL